MFKHDDSALSIFSVEGKLPVLLVDILKHYSPTNASLCFELYRLIGSVSPLFAEALVEKDACSYLAILFQLIKNSGRIDCIKNFSEMGVIKYLVAVITANVYEKRVILRILTDILVYYKVIMKS